jgi:hypothetical protein
VPRIDGGPTDGPPGPPLKTAWLTFSIAETKELLEMLREWDDEVSHDRIDPETHWHIRDSAGNELTVEVREGADSS